VCNAMENSNVAPGLRYTKLGDKNFLEQKENILYRNRDLRYSQRWLAHAGSSLADFSTLKMEARRSSETSVHTRSTRRHIPEVDIIYKL
jgi:hypothetical protein